MANPIVIKIGGHEIEDAAFLSELAKTVAALDVPAIIVHGGGKEISNMQERLGIEPRYIDGVRVTDAESLAIVEMMLCGLINKRLVRYLVTAGVEALGMSGVDRGIIRAHKMPHPSVDMGFTGEVESVRGDVLREMLNSGVMPVIAPISLGPESAYNVNADHVAGAVAAAVWAERVVFITNVEGVLVNNERTPMLSAEQAEMLIDNGTIFGGMIPKVRTALGALESGVPQAAITNLTGLKTHGGTIFTKS